MKANPLKRHYAKKWKEWDKLWKKDIKELGFTRRSTDYRFWYLVGINKRVQRGTAREDNKQ